jgi:hypothetical protein
LAVGSDIDGEAGTAQRRADGRSVPPGIFNKKDAHRQNWL